MKKIKLTRGQVALVDDTDFERVSQHKWFAQWQPRAEKFYAARNTRNQLGQKRVMLMHRFVMGLDFGDARQVDHVNNKRTLDNRRSINLRVVTAAQNRMNSSMWSNNKTGYKGVFWNKQAKKFQYGLRVDGKYIYGGRSDSARAAYKGYCSMVAQHHGEFGRAA